MIWLKHAFGQLISSRRTGAKAVEGASTSQLPYLPPELILSIAGMLPTSSAACLALCSRRLSRILGPSVWTSLLGEAPDAQLAFLSSLAKDLPQHFVCYSCVCLHRINAIKWPRIITLRLSPRCISEDSGYCHLFSVMYRINFPHVQLAMEQHYSGADIGFPLEAFRYTEVEHNETRRKINLLSVDAQIVSNELLMRSQSWTLFPWSRRGKLVENYLLHDLCEHTQMRAGKDNTLPDLMSSRLDKPEARGKCRTQTLQCSRCCMDYMMEATDFGEQGFAVLVTRWINIGAGLNPADAKWRSHRGIRMPKGVIHHPHHLGSIRADFEGQAELSVEELTAENELKLFSRRKHKLVTRGSDGLVWKWGGFGSGWWYLAPSGPPEQSFWSTLAKA